MKTIIALTVILYTGIALALLTPNKPKTYFEYTEEIIPEHKLANDEVYA